MDLEWLALTAKIAAVWIAAAFAFGLVVGRIMAAGNTTPDQGEECDRKTTQTRRGAS